jgi:hypothetical protein
MSSNVSRPIRYQRCLHTCVNVPCGDIPSAVYKAHQYNCYDIHTDCHPDKYFNNRKCAYWQKKLEQGKSFDEIRHIYHNNCTRVARYRTRKATYEKQIYRSHSVTLVTSSNESSISTSHTPPVQSTVPSSSISTSHSDTATINTTQPLVSQHATTASSATDDSTVSNNITHLTIDTDEYEDKMKILNRFAAREVIKLSTSSGTLGVTSTDGNVSYAYCELRSSAINDLCVCMEEILGDMSNHYFVDAGHANGFTLAAIAIRYTHLQCDGIELHDTRHANSRSLKEHVVKLNAVNSDNIRFHKGNISDQLFLDIYKRATILYMYDYRYHAETLNFIVNLLNSRTCRIQLLISSYPFKFWSPSCHVLCDTGKKIKGYFRNSTECHNLYFYTVINE